MNTRFKVFASYNTLQYLCDSIQVFIFVTVSKCRKSPKLTNIVIPAGKVWDNINDAGGFDQLLWWLHLAVKEQKLEED